MYILICVYHSRYCSEHTYSLPFKSIKGAMQYAINKQPWPGDLNWQSLPSGGFRARSGDYTFTIGEVILRK